MTHCELHNVRHCPICDHAPGQCDFGVCQAPAAVNVRYVENDRLVELRPLCVAHAIHPLTMRSATR